MYENAAEVGKFLLDEITCFVRESPANQNPESGIPYFSVPLLGFASATDLLFSRYKQIIGMYHLSPLEVMESACGHLKEQQGTVICWILPIHPSIRAINRTQKQWPSREWSHTRTHGEAFNNLLREHVVHLLIGMGQKAVAPVFTPGWRIVETAAGDSSTWSERHAAFAAGLGTFSLNDGFITEKGMAHRCGSVITDCVMPPTLRPYADRAEYCLFCREGRCGACIGRCPAQAIFRNGHDKKRCFHYTNKEVVDAVGARYAVNALGCGLCQTGVPCESAIPVAQSVDCT